MEGDFPPPLLTKAATVGSGCLMHNPAQKQAHALDKLCCTGSVISTANGR